MSDDYSTNPQTIRSRKSYWASRARRKRQNKAIEKRRKNWLDSGKCYRCGKTRERIEIRHCNEHHTKEIERMKNLKVERALNGQCARCSNTADGNSSHCVDCKLKARLRMREKRNGRREV